MVDLHCAVAFKEWAAVVLALEAGEQKIILRKGGIAEANGTFAPEHNRFWLYPTYFHEHQQQGLKPAAQKWIDIANQHKPSPSKVLLKSLAIVKSVTFSSDWNEISRLDLNHYLTEETVKKRFFYRNPGLFVYHVEIEKTNYTHEIIESSEYAGCKTWVELSSPLGV